MSSMLRLCLGILICLLTISNPSHAGSGRIKPDSTYDLVDTEILDIIKAKQLTIDELYAKRVIEYTCRTYDDYVILVREQTEEYKNELILKCGDEIIVKPRDESADTNHMCAWPHEGGYFRITEWAGYFDGLYGKYLLVEEGTGPSPRSFSIFDLEKQEKIYAATYEVGGPLRIDENYILTFNRMLDKQINTLEECEAYREACPEIDELKRCITGMGGIGLYERVIVNLETLEEERTGEISCSCLQ